MKSRQLNLNTERHLSLFFKTKEQSKSGMTGREAPVLCQKSIYRSSTPINLRNRRQYQSILFRGERANTVRNCIQYKTRFCLLLIRIRLALSPLTERSAPKGEIRDIILLISDMTKIRSSRRGGLPPPCMLHLHDHQQGFHGPKLSNELRWKVIQNPSRSP